MPAGRGPGSRPGRPGARAGEPHRRAHRLQRRVRPAGRDRPGHRDRVRADGGPDGPSSSSPRPASGRRSTSTRSASGPGRGSTTWPGPPGRSTAAGVPLTGFRGALASDLPTGAGLSSSAALELVTAWALAGDRPPALDPLEPRPGLPEGGEPVRRRPVRAHGPVRLGLRRGGFGALPRLPVARPPDRPDPGRPATRRLPLGRDPSARRRRVQHPARGVRPSGRRAVGPRGPPARGPARRRRGDAPPVGRPARPGRAPAGRAHRRRERPRPRDGGRAAGRRPRRRSGGCSRRATPRCATCSRSRRRRWTRSSRSPPRPPASSRPG